MNEYDYLNMVKGIVREADEKTNEKALNFNIFNVLNVSEKEVMMCRVLYEFLNPKGSHGRGSEYLGWFLERVLKLSDVTQDELDGARVFREYVIPNTDRRIDIYIDTPYRAIPVEVKIYAEEQGKQCLDYYVYAKEENDKKRACRKWRLAYLTLSGDMPSKYSTGNDKSCIDSIEKISWVEGILGWMKEIRDSQEENANVKEIVVQYIDVIEGLTNQKKGPVYKSMEEKGLLDGKENMKAAQAISESFAARKTKLIEDLFDAVKEKADKSLCSDCNLDDVFMDPWNNKNLIRTFYQFQKSSLPALNYKMKEFSMQGDNAKYQIWLRFEIDYKPFVSFVLVKKSIDKNGNTQYTGEFDKTNELYEMAESFILQEKSEEFHRNGWWIDWFYVPTFKTEVEGCLPDFKECNDPYYDLYEKDKFNELVNSAVEGMKKMRNRVKCEL